MKDLATIHDPVFTGRDDYSVLDRFFLSLIRDERDLPFIYLSLKISLIMIPFGVGMYFTSGWIFALLAIAYFIVNNFVFKGPFGLMLHCTSHRKWFKAEFEWLNKYLPWVVGPFFGQTPETYYSHHIHMHHSENNLPDDLSSTMFYQRDNFRDWLRYFSVFFWKGVIDLISYFWVRNRKKLVRKVAVGEYLFIIVVVILCFINFWATLHTFILPFFISRIIMMMGNWTQHSFIDPIDPGNPFYNSITCINHKYNHKCWNDGYHISHHQRPHMHWTEHPVYFKKTIDQYAAHKAIIFDGIEFLGIFVALMRGKYDYLADHLVNVNGMFESKEEAIAVMKSRTKRFEDNWQANQ